MKESQFVKAYTIKEVSRSINVPSGTIRQWEKDLDGLLSIPRTRQGARFYTDQEIEMLKKIKQMRDKNLSKDMIRELLRKHMDNSEVSSEESGITLPAVHEHQQPAPQQQPELDIQGFFDALEDYKQGLLKDMKTEIQNGLRTEIVEEVKKDIASGSLQTIKAISLSISRSKEKMKADLDELSQRVVKTSEQTSESLETLHRRVAKSNKGTTEKITNLSENVTKLSKGTNKTLSSLSENVSKLSRGTVKELSTLSSSFANLSKGTSEEIHALSSKLDESAEEFKILTDYISESKEMTHSELHTMNEQLAMDREYFLESIKLEREHFRSEIRERDEIFKDLVGSFRQAAADKEDSKKWWQLWK
ncbi:MerR family transcriptional regulator [Mesobacillus foraminis]|uniref:MerR family transcriptional regulator n=1 Tax=Mesobacillus foraminis TaxID=279826 RepID=UPI0039A0CF8D